MRLPFVVGGNHGLALMKLHAAARTWAETDWEEIAGKCEELLALSPSPVVALNHAVAVAQVKGPEVALPLIAPLEDALGDFRSLQPARGECCGARTCLVQCRSAAVPDVVGA
jgi:predicted RNA polymerase sigma factor